jgi:hypothetical protein
VIDRKVTAQKHEKLFPAVIDNLKFLITLGAAASHQ